ncbi:MAG: choice-of-anchor J domain-containing protein, partial [Flavobacterium sp.]
NFNLPGWSNIVEKASKLWKSIVYGGNGYAEFNTTSTTAAENIAWLVSPKIDMDSYKNAVLSFRSAQHDLKVDSPLNTIEIYVSANFNGSNVTKATWTKLSARVATQSTPPRQFISSGGIDLSSYSGKINIAFKYLGSGKDKTLNGAFMIDDVKIYGEK